MLDDLTAKQRALAEYMSELSEEAYCAGWLEDLEFSLWRIVLDGSGRFGFMEITTEHVSNLKEFSRLCGGWIFFDDLNGETFVSLKDWEKRFANHTEK